MTEQEIKERLGRYLALQMENENQLERLARMRSGVYMSHRQIGSESQHIGSSDRMGMAVDNVLVQENKIASRVESNKLEMETIRRMVENLPDPMEREVLRVRYLDGENVQSLSWKEVAYKLLGKSDDAAQKKARRIHAKAIESLSVSV